MKKEALLKITTRSMEPAGIIILLTGAGGVFKQMLVDTGTGEMLAAYFSSDWFCDGVGDVVVCVKGYEPMINLNHEFVH